MESVLLTVCLKSNVSGKCTQFRHCYQETLIFCISGYVVKKYMKLHKQFSVFAKYFAFADLLLALPFLTSRHIFAVALQRTCFLSWVVLNLISEKPFHNYLFIKLTRPDFPVFTEISGMSGKIADTLYCVTGHSMLITICQFSSLEFYKFYKLLTRRKTC